MITLRQLRYLASLARHRHFGRAAEDCAVTQPALSMQIRELEREIGGVLVERRPGDIVLDRTRPGSDRARGGHPDREPRPGRLRAPPHSAQRSSQARHHPDTGALCAAARSAAAAGGASGATAGGARDADQDAAGGTRPRRARLRDAGAAGGRRRRGDAAFVRRSLPAGAAGGRAVARGWPGKHGGCRPAPAHLAGGRPLSARSGFGVLRRAKT